MYCRQEVPSQIVKFQKEWISYQKLYLGIHVDNLSISFVFKLNARLVISNDLKVGRVVGRTGLSLPIVKAQVRCTGEEEFSSIKIRIKVFGFESMSKVDVSADLLALAVERPNEDDCLREVRLALMLEIRRNHHTVSFPLRLDSSLSARA